MSLEEEKYQKIQMKKDIVIMRLRERGCRITKQRLILLDIILEEDCACCKEIYYQAVKKDSRIGTATVYRMVNILEEIGAISRKNMYKVQCKNPILSEEVCRVEFNDDSICHLSAKGWNCVLQAGLKACGYMEHQGIKTIAIKSSAKEMSFT